MSLIERKKGSLAFSQNHQQLVNLENNRKGTKRSVNTGD